MLRRMAKHGKCTHASVHLSNTTAKRQPRRGVAPRKKKKRQASADCQFRHTEAGGQPSEKSKTSGGEDQLPCERRPYNWVVCPKITIRKSLFWRKENWDQITPSNSPKAPGTKNQNFGKERVHREASFRSVNLMSAIRALTNLRRGTRRNFAPRKMRSQSSMGLREKCLQIQKYG